MNNSLFEQHKQEKERLLAKKYLQRTQLGAAKSLVDSELIKVITGPRRAGKSVFSLLLLENKDFAYVNFEDENLLKITNYDLITEGIFEVYPTAKWIFFDEIQTLPNWEIFVNKLHRRGYNLVITGSNANLLSKELGTALTGRYLPIEVLPFSFAEYLIAKNIDTNKSNLTPEAKGLLLNALRAYLQYGGYPEIVTKDLDAKSYLETLIDAILLKDVVKRYKVRYSQKIYELALYLISNYCSEYTFSSLRKTLNFNSTNTVQKYLHYLEETYLFFSLNRYSQKFKEQIRSPKKMYLVDNGFAAAKAFQVSPNLGQSLENAVFVELLRQGYKPNQSLFYYKTRNKKEIDFVLRQGLRVGALVQVCYDIANAQTKNREIKALLESGQELKCDQLLVITFDFEKKEQHGGQTIQFIPFWKIGAAALCL